MNITRHNFRTQNQILLLVCCRGFVLRFSHELNDFINWKYFIKYLYKIHDIHYIIFFSINGKLISMFCDLRYLYHFYGLLGYDYAFVPLLVLSTCFWFEKFVPLVIFFMFYLFDILLSSFRRFCQTIFLHYIVLFFLLVVFGRFYVVHYLLSICNYFIYLEQFFAATSKKIEQNVDLFVVGHNCNRSFYLNCVFFAIFLRKFNV